MAREALAPWLLVSWLGCFFAINLSYAEDLRFPTTAAEIEKALSIPDSTPSEPFTPHFRGSERPVERNFRGPSRIVNDPPTPTAASKLGANQNSLVKTEKPIPSQQPLKVGAMVHFDFDSARIRPESHALLDEFVKALQSPSLSEVRMIVAGYTDSKGSDAYNQKLSQRRAQAVKDYLVRRGISNTRLIARGFGEEFPIASNATEEGRAKNRRSEFIRADGG